MPIRFASLGESIDGFLSAVGDFFESLARVDPIALFIALVAFGIYLTIRSRAYFHVLRAAYPTERFQWRRIWGAYVAAYGFNNVVPARGGDIIKLFLTRSSIPRSSAPTVGSSFFVENVFDLCMAIPILAFAFSRGAFPKPPDFASLNAFDLSYFAERPRFALFCITALMVLTLVLFAVLSVRVKAFWARMKQGVVILRDRRRYFREVFLVQLLAWVFRFTAFWFLLEAFGVGGSVEAVLLVLGVNAIVVMVPFTPGGAGVQQALLVKVFEGVAPVATVTAYSVAQQIAIGAFSFALGFFALAVIFRVRSFKAVIRQGKEASAAEKAAEKAAARAG